MNDDTTVAHGVMFWFFLLDSFKNIWLSNHNKVLLNFGFGIPPILQLQNGYMELEIPTIKW